ncbi:MAG: TlpA family protein disulfide reductase [Planctomycetes bacterium]|nr:TlpA family protein disulfide reductase [Planctomycetota bacterium]
MAARWRWTAAALVLGGAWLVSGCNEAAQAPRAPDAAARPAGDEAPCPSPIEAPAPAAAAKAEIPRFVADSPFDADFTPPEFETGKRLWARSCLWAEAPKLVVEKWLTDAPDTRGKYVLVEFWATWCPPCRRSIALLNAFHEKFGKELVVIGISDETEEAVRKLKAPAIRYYSAVDTQAWMKNELGVFGIPHVIVVEPGGCVVWEGFPLLKGHELTEATIEKILAVGRKK